MPYKSEKIKIVGTKYDRRVKLSPERREELRQDKGQLSQRAAARKYGVSRRLVQFIWYPERLEEQKRAYKERRKDGRYYKQEQWAEIIKDHRKWKQKLYLEGKIKF